MNADQDPEYQRLLREMAAHVDQMTKDLEAVWQQSIAHFLQQLEEVDKALQPVVRQLAVLGWTVPLWAPPALPGVILEHVEASRIDELFVNTYRRRWYADYKRMFASLRRRTALGQWRPLLDQCNAAFRRKQYLIVVPSLLLVLEGLLASSADSLSRRASPRNISKGQFARTQNFRAVLWASIDSFVQAIFARHDFADPRPAVLNRHWILHGRDETNWTEADCLRLFQALDTLSFVVQSAIDEAGRPDDKGP